MFSIRTIVVMTAFVAAGLASAAEYLVDRIEAEEAAFMSVEAAPAATPATASGLGLEASAPIVETLPVVSPWI